MNKKGGTILLLGNLDLSKRSCRPERGKLP
jgi:hypothetical protein